MNKTVTKQNSWQEVKLGDIFEIQNGYSFKSSDYVEFISDELEVLKMGHIERGGGLRKEPKKNYVPRSEKLKKWILDKGNIVIAMTDMKDNVVILGVPALIDKDDHYVLNQRVAGLRLKEKNVDLDFVYNYLKWNEFLGTLRSKANSGVQVNLTTDAIKNSIILLPPPQEQKAIAEILSSLDEKIDLLYRQNNTLEDMTQALFRKWFVEEAKNNWEEKTLDEVVDIGIGRTPPRKEFEWFSKSSEHLKWISIKDMGTSGVYIFDTAEYLTQKAVDRFKIPEIPKNTIVLSFKMTVGRVGITTEKMLSNEAIAHFKFKLDTPFSEEYLYLFLKTYKFDSLGSTSSIVTSINSAMIKNMVIVIPDEKHMNKFKLVSKPMFEKIFYNQSHIRTLENLRNTLLPKLMSGEVRLKDFS